MRVKNKLHLPGLLISRIKILTTQTTWSSFILLDCLQSAAWWDLLQKVKSLSEHIKKYENSAVWKILTWWCSSWLKIKYAELMQGGFRGDLENSHHLILLSTHLLRTFWIQSIHNVFIYSVSVNWMRTVCCTWVPCSSCSLRSVMFSFLLGPQGPLRFLCHSQLRASLNLGTQRLGLLLFCITCCWV